MLESVLTRKNHSLKMKITVKSLLSVGLIALAVVLPQIVHISIGPSGGMQWLPMYLPVLLGGCLLGVYWGLGIGIMSPIVSFLMTLGIGNPMPAAARLPFMVIELAVFAVVSGLFTKKIALNGWLTFPAVLLAQIAGRGTFLLLVFIFQSIIPFSPSVVWSQIQTGFLGMLLQAIVVPFLIMGLKITLGKEKND